MFYLLRIVFSRFLIFFYFPERSRERSSNSSCFTEVWLRSQVVMFIMCLKRSCCPWKCSIEEAKSDCNNRIFFWQDSRQPKHNVHREYAADNVSEKYSTLFKSSPSTSALPGTAAPKTWPSLQPKPSLLTGSCRSTTSSRRTSEPSFAPWGFLLLPTPDWHADGRSPTPCAPGTSHLHRTTSLPEGSAPSPLVIVSDWCVCMCVCACMCVVFTGSLVGSPHSTRSGCSVLGVKALSHGQ